VFAPLGHYFWHWDDRPGGKPNELSPDVLGYSLHPKYKKSTLECAWDGV
jgi:hypothetical protein